MESGAVTLGSKFYIERPTDEKFLFAISRRDSIISLKGARQMGKTSLLARGLQKAREMGAKVVLTDFQALSEEQLESPTKLFIALGEIFADALDLDVYPADVWKEKRSAATNFNKYIQNQVLAKAAKPIVWAMDETDRLFTYSYASEVFGLLRSWHNARALDPETPWQKITLAIAYATETHLIITDLNQSPFNVGLQLALDDFTLEQVQELNLRYGRPLPDESAIQQFYHLVGGHPYLTRRGLHEIATQKMDINNFVAQASDDDGPYGDHLRHLILLLKDSALKNEVKNNLAGKHCLSAETFYQLRSAGIMAGKSMQTMKPRCQIYAEYLKAHLQ
jgi:hypothetical protein